MPRLSRCDSGPQQQGTSDAQKNVESNMIMIKDAMHDSCTKNNKVKEMIWGQQRNSEPSARLTAGFK